MSAGPFSLAVVGVSHRTAPVALRERVAIAGDAREGALKALAALVSGEVMLVSTCNRVEIFLAAEDPDLAIDKARDWLCGRAPTTELPTHLFSQSATEALTHLFRVASSLDSMVIGEAQILGQLKEAFDAAKDAGTLGPVLQRAASRAFHAAKRIRTETQLGVGQVSVASVAVELARSIFSELDGREVLLLGAGEIAESAAKALRSAGASKLCIANRNVERAVALAEAMPGARAHALSELPRLLEEADVVLVSTGAPEFVVTQAMALQAVRRRRGRPLFFVDVAVPRNVDPRVHDLDGCYRYDIDDLQLIVSEGQKERQAEVQAAERILADELRAYVAWARQSSVTPTVVALRERFRSVLAGELERTLAGRLRHLGDDDRKALNVMVEAATNKLLHHPTMLLKQNADDPELDAVVALVGKLFALEPNSNPKPEMETEGGKG